MTAETRLLRLVFGGVALGVTFGALAAWAIGRLTGHTPVVGLAAGAWLVAWWRWTRKPKPKQSAWTERPSEDRLLVEIDTASAALELLWENPDLAGEHKAEIVQWQQRLMEWWEQIVDQRRGGDHADV